VQYQKFYDAPEVPCAKSGRSIGHRLSMVALSRLLMRTDHLLLPHGRGANSASTPQQIA